GLKNWPPPKNPAHRLHDLKTRLRPRGHNSEPLAPGNSAMDRRRRYARQIRSCVVLTPMPPTIIGPSVSPEAKNLSRQYSYVVCAARETSESNRNRRHSAPQISAEEQIDFSNARPLLPRENCYKFDTEATAHSDELSTGWTLPNLRQNRC